MALVFNYIDTCQWDEVPDRHITPNERLVTIPYHDTLSPQAFITEVIYSFKIIPIHLPECFTPTDVEQAISNELPFIPFYCKGIRDNCFIYCYFEW